ncbi:rnhA [Mytilus coruscus]|uniref:ribonuclease H n=1 Tax=Mytilus coruscus TaxID=42192 RepID=A0A6J8BPA7_MYTCO|nr:rnhA [Mytilus coruscus]
MEVYIDGACKNNGKPLAKASYGIFWEPNNIKNINGPVPESYKQTNNTGELYAAVKCLQQIHDNQISNINIKTDSEYLVRGITSDIVYWKSNNWKLKSSGKDVKNKELWSEIDDLLSNINVSWVHVARDSEIGQIEADKLAKLALNIKTSSVNTIQANDQSTVNVCNDIEWSDDEEETIPMKVATPRRSNSNNKLRKTSTKANSPSFCTMSALRRIESLLLSTSEEVLNLNDALNCHIDSSNSQFQEIKDKFASLTNTVKAQTSSALTSVQDVFTQTQLIKSEIEINNKAFVNKSNSLWDKLNAVSNEIKSVNLKSSHVNVLTETVTETPNRKREGRISDKIKQINKTTPGTYSNAVKSGLPSSSNKPVSLNRTNLGTHHDTQNPTYMERQRSQINTKYTDREVNSTYPHFLRSSEKKNLFLVGSSTLKKMSPRKMSTEQINTKVKTIRGGRIRDIEDCLIQYISEGKLDCVDVIVVHVGTNNVSDGDSVHAIIDDYRNLICTVRQSLPRTELVISSILPRPTHYQANRTIYDVNNRLLSLEEQHVEILDNTLDFLYGDQPNLTLFADHVHTNVAGAKVLSHNIISCVNTLLNLSDCTSETQSNFQSVRSTGRRFIPFNTTTQQQNVFRQTYWR